MPKHFGNGILQAHSALGVAPDLNRSRSPTSESELPPFPSHYRARPRRGPAREQMSNLELEQRLLMNARLQSIVRDPNANAR